MIIPLTHSETHTPLPGPLVKLTGSDEILLIELQGTLETTAARDGQHVGVLSLEADTNVSTGLSLLSFSVVSSVWAAISASSLVCFFFILSRSHSCGTDSPCWCRLNIPFASVLLDNRVEHPTLDTFLSAGDQHPASTR